MLNLDSAFVVLKIDGGFGNIEVTARCKECERIFLVELAKDKQTNCNIDYSTDNLKVTCPGCKTEAESKAFTPGLFSAEKELASLDKELKEYMNNFQKKHIGIFRILDVDMTTIPGPILTLNCPSCDSIFAASPTRNVEMCNGEMFIKCPTCPHKDVFTKEDLLDREEIISKIRRFEELKGTLANEINDE
jgi:hypothetical protein